MRLFLNQPLAAEQKTTKLDGACLRALELTALLARHHLNDYKPDAGPVHVEKFAGQARSSALVVHHRRDDKYFCTGIRFNHEALDNDLRGRLHTLVVFGRLMPESTPMWDPHLIHWEYMGVHHWTVQNASELEAAMLHATQNAFDWIMLEKLPEIRYLPTTF